MRDYRILKVLDKISFIFKKFGINYELMRTILKVKLTLDSRRVPTVLSNNTTNNKDKNMFFSSLWIYVLFGFFMMIIVLMDISMFVKMSLSIGINMFMLMTTMISDFSSILLNVKDKNIMMTKPIDLKTYNAAKIIHILIYLFYIAMSMNLLSMIAGTIKYGVVFLLLYIIELILICAFILFMTSLIYHLVLNFFDGEKLKDMINGFQIVLSIIIIVGYQVLVRSMSLINLDISLNFKWWTYLIPPIWFAAPYEVILTGNRNVAFVVLSFGAFIIPLLCLWVHFKVIAPRFEKNLLKLNQNGKRKNAHRKHRKAIRKRRIYCLISPNKIENMFLRFTKNILSSERKLKLKIYPNLAFASIFPFLLLYTEFTSGKSFSESLAMLGKSDSYFSLYASVLLLASLFGMIIYSDSYKGAWIYRTLPLEKSSIIMKGALKGFVLKYYCVIFFFTSLIFWWIFGNRIVIDLVIMFLNLIVTILVAFQFSEKELPFSKSLNDIPKNNVGSFFIILFIVGVLGIVHYLTRNVLFLKLGYGAVVLILVSILYHSVLNLKWSNLMNN